MSFPVEKFQQIQTPFYFYDKALLQRTLDSINTELSKYPDFRVHYAVKANVDLTLLGLVKDSGLGCDCVSGGEIRTCLQAGFDPSKIVYAGVGKADWEIRLALESGIACFNVESVPELEVIDSLAREYGKVAQVAIRVNPNVDAHTHKNITTGLPESKFGIPLEMLDEVVAVIPSLHNVSLQGLHFHIGSQLLDLAPYTLLCERVNQLQDHFESMGIRFATINVGGGLGCDYEHPDENPIPDFAAYFANYAAHLKLRPGQQVHFELGRAVVCQCGSLISRVLYIKQGLGKKFMILDAGMSDLIRPALYQAHHKIENISASLDAGTDIYDVVGPICETSDCFGVDECLPCAQRGDLIALRSAGAYGQIMASHYNCRPIPPSVVL